MNAENRLQSECFLWHWNSFPWDRQMLFHVNNKASNAIEGNKFKAMGVVKGVSDLIYISNGKTYFFELKTDTGRQRPDQATFQKQVQLRGHHYFIIRSLQDFKGHILDIMGTQHHTTPLSA